MPLEIPEMPTPPPPMLASSSRPEPSDSIMVHVQVPRG